MRIQWLLSRDTAYYSGILQIWIYVVAVHSDTLGQPRLKQCKPWTAPNRGGLGKIKALRGGVTTAHDGRLSS